MSPPKKKTTIESWLNQEVLFYDRYGDLIPNFSGILEEIDTKTGFVIIGGGEVKVAVQLSQIAGIRLKGEK